MLVEAGANIHVRDSYARPLLSKTDAPEVLKFLLERKAPVLKDKKDQRLWWLLYREAGNTVTGKEVEQLIKSGSNPEYFNDSVCRNGYFRGLETYHFVREIRARHRIYIAKIKD